ncbi:hypothetical protein Nos7524_2816 [Nostoc sp. PCC 7524]|uniref:hypothetical protein n=1 Tax=Nostoc sp. (strain ATCC 29411 / PCC 7524) TaxID=28072 RepID=UPI00029F00F4|nr:hypothetical protein [Nostoc sp. PCC 7524]AFY48636.1 hypothetical protein Nos7524_2816 [Nostoc sp. PCC 7524]
MPNWSAIEASFVNQTHAQQLGELAACLARLNSWLEKSANRELVPLLIEESLVYLSLIKQKNEINNFELNELQDLLQAWKQEWINIWDKPTETARIAVTASNWSQLILDMSGLLTSESMSA